MDTMTYEELAESWSDLMDRTRSMEKTEHILLQALERDDVNAMIVCEDVGEERARVSVTIGGKEYTAANGDTVILNATSEVLDDGYDEVNGQRYKRVKPGRLWWYAIANDSLLFVTRRKPERDATPDRVVLEWGN